MEHCSVSDYLFDKNPNDAEFMSVSRDNFEGGKKEAVDCGEVEADKEDCLSKSSMQSVHSDDSEHDPGQIHSSSTKVEFKKFMEKLIKPDPDSGFDVL